MSNFIVCPGITSIGGSSFVLHIGNPFDVLIISVIVPYELNFTTQPLVGTHVILAFRFVSVISDIMSRQ